MFGHLFQKHWCKLNRNGHFLDVKTLVAWRDAIFDFVGVEAILRKQCNELEKLMKFSYKWKGQMNKGLRIARMPLVKKNILDEFYQFPGELVEERFARGHVDNGKLHSTDVCTGHYNIIHGIDLADAFDVGRHLLATFLTDRKALLITL